MPNIARTGFWVSRQLASAPFNESIETFLIPASDAADTYVGDLVKLTGAVDATTGTPIASVCAAADVPVGVVVGFVADLDYLNSKYRAANTARYVMVATSPQLVMSVQFIGVPVVNPVGKFSAIKIGAGSTLTGMSGQSIDTPSSTAAQLKIVGISKVVGNDPASANVTYDVIFAQHQYK